MRVSIILIGVLTAALLVAQRGIAAAEDTACADACQKTYASCTAPCAKQKAKKATDCYTKCINAQQSCLVRCDRPR